MKRKTLYLLLMLLFVLTAASCASPSTENTGGGNGSDTETSSDTGIQANAISIEGFAFKPAALTVKVGETVTWTNNDSAEHNIKSADFNSPNLATGSTYAFKFEKAGTYDYSCGIHPAMMGRIIVE